MHRNSRRFSAPSAIARTMITWGVLCLLLVCAPSVRAATLVSVNPTLSPSGPQPPTFVFAHEASGPAGSMQFAGGSGSLGNGDGNLPISSQTPPGLELKTPLTILLPTQGQQINGDGSTNYYDTSLVLTGLFAQGAVQQITVSGITFDFQALNGGTFSIYSTVPGTGYTTGNPGQLLLSGTLNDATISGLDGGTIGSTLSATVQYTGGAIYTQLLAHGGTTTGSVTFNLSLTLGGTFQKDGSSPNFLLPFVATGQGIFSTQTVPEPTSVALAAVGACGLLAFARLQRRRAKRV